MLSSMELCQNYIGVALLLFPLPLPCFPPSFPFMDSPRTPFSLSHWHKNTHSGSLPGNLSKSQCPEYCAELTNRGSYIVLTLIYLVLKIKQLPNVHILCSSNNSWRTYCILESSNSIHLRLDTYLIKMSVL